MHFSNSVPLLTWFSLSECLSFSFSLENSHLAMLKHLKCHFPWVVFLDSQRRHCFHILASGTYYTPNKTRAHRVPGADLSDFSVSWWWSSQEDLQSQFNNVCWEATLSDTLFSLIFLESPQIRHWDKDLSADNSFERWSQDLQEVGTMSQRREKGQLKDLKNSP